MRIFLAALAILISGAMLDTAKADPYKWCAEYSGGDTGAGGTNCYFVTLEQCKWQISGMGGFCRPNPFYDGRPVVTPEDRPAPRRKRH